MPKLSNASSTAISPKMGDGSRGVVQAIIDGSNAAHLYGSLNGTDYQLIESFTASTIKEIVLCPYFKLSTSASSVTGTVGGNTKVIINETR